MLKNTHIHDKSILSEFNWKRCRCEYVRSMCYGIPIILESDSKKFYPHRATLRYNDAETEVWVIKGVWENGHCDTILKGYMWNFVNIRHRYDSWCSVKLKDGIAIAIYK